MESLICSWIHRHFHHVPRVECHAKPQNSSRSLVILNGETNVCHAYGSQCTSYVYPYIILYLYAFANVSMWVYARALVVHVEKGFRLKMGVNGWATFHSPNIGQNDPDKYDRKWPVQDSMQPWSSINREDFVLVSQKATQSTNGNTTTLHIPWGTSISNNQFCEDFHFISLPSFTNLDNLGGYLVRP